MNSCVVLRTSSPGLSSSIPRRRDTLPSTSLVCLNIERKHESNFMQEERTILGTFGKMDVDRANATHVGHARRCERWMHEAFQGSFRTRTSRARSIWHRIRGRSYRPSSLPRSKVFGRGRNRSLKTRRRGIGQEMWRGWIRFGTWKDRGKLF